MFYITTLNTHTSSNGYTWKKGQTGKDAKQLRIDVEKHKGLVSGNLGFNGTTGYEIISGVIFQVENDQISFLAEFGPKYNGVVTDTILMPGIDTDDISF